MPEHDLAFDHVARRSDCESLSYGASQGGKTFACTVEMLRDCLGPQTEEELAEWRRLSAESEVEEALACPGNRKGVLCCADCSGCAEDTDGGRLND